MLKQDNCFLERTLLPSQLERMITISEKGTYSLVHRKHVFCFSFPLLNIIHSKKIYRNSNQSRHTLRRFPKLLNLHFIPPNSISTGIHRWIFIPVFCSGLCSSSHQWHAGIPLTGWDPPALPWPLSCLGEPRSPPAPFPCLMRWELPLLSQHTFTAINRLILLPHFN